MKDKIAIHCPTEELWNRAQEKAFSEGWGWSGKKGDSYQEDFYEKYKERSCLWIKDSKYLEYSPKEYYENNGYTIIPAEEWLAELKVGDRVEVVGSMTIGKISECDGGGMYRIVNKEGSLISWYPSKDLKLIESEKGKGDSMKEHSVPLRVGDKVRVVGEHKIHHGLAMGTTGTISELSSEGNFFFERNTGNSRWMFPKDLELIPTEADITVGSVWEWKVKKIEKKVISLEEGFVKYYCYSSLGEHTMKVSKFLEIYKLIHRGDEEGVISDVVTSPGVWTDAQCQEHFNKGNGKQTNKKEKKMKTKVISVGLEIIDKACNNIGKVAYYNKETGKVAYEEASGDLTVGHIDNINVSPVKVIMPKPVKKVVKKKSKK